MSAITSRWQGSFARRFEDDGDRTLLEILRLSTATDVISFAGGFPDPETFPREAILDGIRDLVGSGDSAALQYGPVDGLPGPRDLVADRIHAADGSRPSPSELIITSGGIEALQLVNQTFLDPGDTVLVEGPTYLGAIMSFRSFGAELIAVSMDEGGIDVDEIEKLIKSGAKPKLVYTIPDHQNPTGRSLSLERRRRLAELADRFGFLIVEDVAYRELHFEGSPLPSIRFLAPNCTIQIGTFSKTFVPGFRLGWATGPAAVIEKLVRAKQLTDQCASSLGQSLLEWYARSGQMDQQLGRSRVLYKGRRDLLLNALTKHMPEHASWTRPKGGFFVWLTATGEVDTSLLAAHARSVGLAYVPGAVFYPDGRGHNQLRLSYSNVADSAIDEGARRLGRLLADSR